MILKNINLCSQAIVMHYFKIINLVVKTLLSVLDCKNKHHLVNLKQKIELNDL